MNFFNKKKTSSEICHKTTTSDRFQNIFSFIWSCFRFDVFYPLFLILLTKFVGKKITLVCNLNCYMCVYLINVIYLLIYLIHLKQQIFEILHHSSLELYHSGIIVSVASFILQSTTSLTALQCLHKKFLISNFLSTNILKKIIISLFWIQQMRHVFLLILVYAYNICVTFYVIKCY